MKSVAIPLLLFLSVTTCRASLLAADPDCTAPGAACPPAASVASTREPITIVHTARSAHHAAITRPLSFNEVMSLQHVPGRLVDRLVRTDGPYLFTLDSEWLRADALLPAPPWPSGLQPAGGYNPGVPRVGAAASRATLVHEFGNASSDARWIKPINGIDMASLSPHGRLESAAAHPELIFRVQHAAFSSQFEPVRRQAEPAVILPQPSVAWPLLLGLFLVVLRRAPLRCCPGGMWLAARHS